MKITMRDLIGEQSLYSIEKGNPFIFLFLKKRGYISSATFRL